MTSRLMKWVSIAVLLVGLLAQSSTGYRIVLNLVVCVSALVVLWEAVRAEKYFWGICFLSIAVLFNPLVSLGFPGRMFLWLDLSGATMFAVSLRALNTQPRLSIGGIIRPHQRRESL